MDIKIDGLKDIKKLLDGSHDSQTKIQLGYDGEKAKIAPAREDGEKWFDEQGNEWEQKDGYSLKLGKKWQQELHEYLNTFPKCQKETCTCIMPKKLDEKMRRIHGMCLDCVVSMEHKLRIEGKWEEYEKTKLKENAMAWLNEAESDKNRIVDELTKLEFTKNEFGDIEKWDTRLNKEELLLKIESEFDEFRKNFIEKLEKDLEQINNEK